MIACDDTRYPFSQQTVTLKDWKNLSKLYWDSHESSFCLTPKCGCHCLCAEHCCDCVVSVSLWEDRNHLVWNTAPFENTYPIMLALKQYEQLCLWKGDGILICRKLFLYFFSGGMGRNVKFFCFLFGGFFPHFSSWSWICLEKEIVPRMTYSLPFPCLAGMPWGPCSGVPRGITQSLPGLQFGPFFFSSVPSGSGAGGQQAVWLLATCTSFLFLSLLLPPPKKTHEVLVARGCLPYQKCHCAARDLAQASSAALCFKKRSNGQLIWFGFYSVLATSSARKGGGVRRGDWWRGRSVEPMWCCNKPGASLGGKCSPLIYSSE